MLTVEQAAPLYGVSPRQLRNLCAAGLIEGAVRFGARAWMVPEGAKRLPGPRRGRPPSTAKDVS